MRASADLGMRTSPPQTCSFAEALIVFRQSCFHIVYADPLVRLSPNWLLNVRFADGFDRVKFWGGVGARR